MKKKITALCLVVAMAVVAVGGATLAYFTDHDQVNNTFTIGNIDIDLYEHTKEYGDQKFQEYLAYSDIMPGDKMSKEPWVENTGDYAAYVRVCVVMNHLDIINNCIDNVYEGKINPKTNETYTAEEIQAIYDEVFDGWGVNYNKRSEGGRRMWMDAREDNCVLFGGQIDTTGMNVKPTEENDNTGYGTFDIMNHFKTENEKDICSSRNDGFLYYNLVDGFGGVTNNDGYYDQALKNDERIYVFYLKLDAGEKYKLFNGLNAPADFSNHAVTTSGQTINQMDMFKDLKIGVYADAIQVANFDTAEAAFTTLEADHPMGWWNT